MPGDGAGGPPPGPLGAVDELAVCRRHPALEGCTLPVGIHPVLRRILAARGVASLDDVRYRLAGLAAPTGLGELEAAAERIAAAVTGQEPTVIAGDFDADGATGTALCVLALRAMGHGAVSFAVPDRFRHGYGLGPALVAEIARRDAPGLLVTVDNGVSSAAGVDAARERGIDVVVTDHHLPGALLPAARAIVNPNLPGATFPSKHLAGVGVAFYTLLAVRRRLVDLGWFGPGRPAPRLADLVDLVALGTVADLVALDRNNRILVSQGLRRIRRGPCRPGIAALLDLAGRDAGRATATDLAFAVAPRLNAAGRLDDMTVGIRCLLADTVDEALPYATTLHRLNAERRRLQSEMEIEAELLVDERADEDLVLCAMDERWHAGVVGLVASKLKERWHRPSVAFACEGDTGSLKGSARSIPGFHIRDALSWVDAQHPGLVERFGGHAMAAGLSLPRERFGAFRAAMQDCARATLAPALLQREVWTDGELGPEELSVELATALRDWGPWGQGFPEPLFEGWFSVLGRRAIGDRHTKLSVRSEAGGPTLDALLFNRPSDHVPQARRVRLVYQLDLNEYLGRVTAQLVVRHLVGAA